MSWLFVIGIKSYHFISQVVGRLVNKRWIDKQFYCEHKIVQIGKERTLGYDACFLDYFVNGEYMIIGGSNKQVSFGPFALENEASTIVV